MKVAITGTPGAGKTTLAAAIAAEFGLEHLSSGDVGRRVDPAAIARGDMADPELLKAGVADLVRSSDNWVLDGYPRSEDQAATLGPDVEVILMSCSRDIALERLRRRGRSDDTDELIIRRYDTQKRLLDLDNREGWAATLATWRRMIGSNHKTPAKIAADVGAYLRGEKREVV